MMLTLLSVLILTQPALICDDVSGTVQCHRQGAGSTYNFEMIKTRPPVVAIIPKPAVIKKQVVLQNAEKQWEFFSCELEGAHK